jgi:hypothetical protein
MLHVFFGNGAVAVRLKTFAFVASLEKEGYKLERIEEDQYMQGTCTDIATSVSLFGGKTVYLLDTPSSDALFNEEVLASLPLFKESENVFVIIEEKLLAPEKKVFTKYAVSMEEITSAVEVRFNAFSMADSLANKDKKTLWLQLQDAKHAGRNYWNFVVAVKVDASCEANKECNRGRHERFSLQQGEACTSQF